MNGIVLGDHFPRSTVTEFQSQWEDGWFPRGPSIAQSPDGTFAAMLIVGDLWRPMRWPPEWDDGIVARTAKDDGVIRTRNFFSVLDNDLRPLGWVEQPTVNVPVLFPDVLGVEEPRLYWTGDGWGFTGAIRQHHVSGDANVAVCRVGSPDVEIWPEARGVWRKNVMPHQDRIVDVFPQDSRLHGGAVVPFEDGFLGVVHEISDARLRRYEQRFCRFDAEGRLLRVGRPFRFSVWPLDVAAGIVVRGDDVIVSFSLQDQTCCLASIPLVDVVGSL